MTNGEKFKEIFKLSQVDECDLNVYAWLPIHDAIEIPLEWWNAEYEDSTTKNNLGVDAVSRAEAIKCLECDFDITGKENMKTVVNYINSAHDKIVNLPSVTPQEPKTGHWIKHDNGVWWECSKCHAERAYGNEYCPDCGSHNGDIAKMVEPQESEG